MKKNIIIISILVILVVAMGLAFKPFQQSGITGNTPSFNTFITPKYGHSECRENVDVEVSDKFEISSTTKMRVRCTDSVGEFDTADKCNIYLTVEDQNKEGFLGSNNDNSFFYSINGGEEKRLKFLGSSGEDKIEDSAGNREDFKIIGPNSDDSFSPDDYVDVEYWDMDNLLGNSKDDKIKGGLVYVDYRKKWLFIENSDNFPWSGRDQSVFGCDITKLYSEVEKTPQFKDTQYNIIKDNTDPSQISNTCSGKECVVGGVNVWLEKEVIETIKTQDIVEIDDELKYCVVSGTATLFDIEEMEYLSDGVLRTAKYRGDVDKQVTCCPSESTSERTCELKDGTLSWVESKIEDRECSFTYQCPGQGIIYYPDPDKPSEESKYKCDSGKCTKFGTRTVECNNLLNCGSGKTCQNRKCVDVANPPVDPEEDERRDCSLKGGVWKTVEDSKCGILCKFSITNPTIITSSFCDEPLDMTLIYLIIAVTIIIVVGMVILAFRIPPKGGMKK